MQSQLKNISYPIFSREEWKALLYPMGLRDEIYRQETHIPDKGFPIITRELVEVLRQLVGSEEVFEVGAGTGYLARALSDQGVNIRAIDSQQGICTRETWWEGSLYFNVEKRDHTEFDVFPGRYVIMSWPCYDSDFALEVARKIQPEQFLIYQGEGRGGCTGNDAFFDYLSDKTLAHRFYPCRNSDSLNDATLNFSGLSDWWKVYYRL